MKILVYFPYRGTLWADFTREQVIRPVPHRHMVFALPKVLRPALLNSGISDR